MCFCLFSKQCSVYYSLLIDINNRNWYNALTRYFYCLQPVFMKKCQHIIIYTLESCWFCSSSVLSLGHRVFFIWIYRERNWQIIWKYSNSYRDHLYYYIFLKTKVKIIQFLPSNYLVHCLNEVNKINLSFYMYKYVEILENCELENELYCVAENKYFFSRIHLNLG